MLYNLRKTPGNSEWFQLDRLGMFIHFGLYSLAARHEWFKTREFIDNEGYQKYFDNFNPDLLDARKWARLAKQAGMKYAVLTTKHHEGFCLFDSNFTDYKVTNTPFGRDIVREYVDAFRAEGLKIGFYYSLIDWHHEDFTIDTYHPLRKRENAEELNLGRDMAKYRKYMLGQLDELMSNYGKIDILWMDFSYPSYTQKGDPEWFRGKGKDDWGSEDLIRLVRSKQPDILINNRMDIEQDLFTPEDIELDSFLTHKQTGEKVVWELCNTLCGSWGYYRDEMHWKDNDMILRLLISSVSKGGNLLLNVGPNGRGEIEKRAEERLLALGEWMRVNSRAIYSCTMAEEKYEVPFGTMLTESQDGKRLYVHMFSYPNGHLLLRGLAGKVKYAQFLHDGSEIGMSEGAVQHFAEEGVTRDKDLLVCYLPQPKPSIPVPVIELILE